MDCITVSDIVESSDLAWAGDLKRVFGDHDGKRSPALTVFKVSHGVFRGELSEVVWFGLWGCHCRSEGRFEGLVSCLEV